MALLKGSGKLNYSQAAYWLRVNPDINTKK